MNITDVRIRNTEEGGRLKAIASVTFDNEFVVHDIKILSNEDGSYFIAMPSKKTATGEYKDIAHPINSEFRKYIQDTILEAFNKK